MFEICENYYSVYNGTNHELAMYDMSDVYTTRTTNMYFLKSNSKCKYSTYEQEFPLNVERSYCTPPLCILPNYYDYDTIVVSSKYAKTAMEQCFRIDPHYLDRLYTPITVYDTEKDKNPVGAVGFKKVVAPWRVEDYYNIVYWHLNSGGVRPSLSAIKLVLDDPYIKVNPYMSNYVYYLSNYIQNAQVDMQNGYVMSSNVNYVGYHSPNAQVGVFNRPIM